MAKTQLCRESVEAFMLQRSCRQLMPVLETGIKSSGMKQSWWVRKGSPFSDSFHYSQKEAKAAQTNENSSSELDI